LHFFANGKLLKMPAAGGTPQALANVLAARGGTWGSQNVIIYSPDTATHLLRINADGVGLRKSSVSPTKDEQTQRWARISSRWRSLLVLGGEFLQL